MGVFDDFISSLDGLDNIDVEKTVAKLHELHQEELGTRDAKIEELNTSLSGANETLAEREAEIVRQKAKNFDLSMSLPGIPVDKQEQQKNDSGRDSELTIDDLFEKKG